MADEWRAVANKVAGRRMQLGLSQKEAAAKAGISEANWNVIENARQERYKPRTLVGVCRALEWTTDSIDRVLAGGEPTLLIRTPAGQLVHLSDAELAEQIAALAAEIRRRHGLQSEGPQNA